MEAALPTAHPCIIVIDDDPLVRDFVVHTMEFGLNQKVTAFDSGFKGWRYIRDRSIPGDIVIADANIPDMDGLELLKRVKSIHPRIVFVVISSQIGDERTARQLNADAFVAKPFDVDDLITIMRKLLPIASRPEKPDPVFCNRSD